MTKMKLKKKQTEYNSSYERLNTWIFATGFLENDDILYGILYKLRKDYYKEFLKLVFRERRYLHGVFLQLENYAACD
jgi:hypothetical protein